MQIEVQNTDYFTDWPHALINIAIKIKGKSQRLVTLGFGLPGDK